MLSRDDDNGDSNPRVILDKMLGDEDFAPSGPFVVGPVAEPKYQPINCATHECLRGPCRHFWQMTARLGDTDIGDQIQLKYVTQCNAHYEATDLAEENIYHCGLWWPAPLSWVPVSLQALLRPHLRRFWVQWLKMIGYDFSWKDWSDDIFTSDNRRRGKQL